MAELKSFLNIKGVVPEQVRVISAANVLVLILPSTEANKRFQ